MKVLFVQDVTGTAYAGDIKEVKPGFARNFLLPNKLAVPASSDQLNRVKRLQSAASVRKEAAETEMKTLGNKLNGAVITIEARAGRNDRLYGSITNAVVAEEVSKLAGRVIDRRRLVMEPIRTLGTYTVPVKLFPGVEPKVKIAVVASGEAVEEPTADEVIASIAAEKKQKVTAAPAVEQTDEDKTEAAN